MSLSSWCNKFFWSTNTFQALNSRRECLTSVFREAIIPTYICKDSPITMVWMGICNWFLFHFVSFHGLVPSKNHIKCPWFDNWITFFDNSRVCSSLFALSLYVDSTIHSLWSNTFNLHTVTNKIKSKRNLCQEHVSNLLLTKLFW